MSPLSKPQLLNLQSILIDNRFVVYSTPTWNIHQSRIVFISDGFIYHIYNNLSNVLITYYLFMQFSHNPLPYSPLHRVQSVQYQSHHFSVSRSPHYSNSIILLDNQILTLYKCADLPYKRVYPFDILCTPVSEQMQGSMIRLVFQYDF